MIGDTAATLEHADDFSFVVSDREFIERANGAADKQDNVRGAHVNEVSSFVPETGVDNRIGTVIGEMIALHVFKSILGRRYAEGKPTVATKRRCHQMRNSGGRAGHQNAA